MKIKSILSALLLMVSSVASAQYLNVKLEDGTCHSYKTTPNMKVSFGDKAGAEIMEPAQVVKLYKGDQLVAEYWNYEFDRVVYEELPPTTGTAKRTDNIDVNWVQLWKGGPKFAVYNVGATSATDYGGYYTWGGTYNNNPALEGFQWTDDHDKGESNLSRTGDNITDTATKLWGCNWRMPTQAELQALLKNCTCTWTTQNNVNGLLCRGKEGTAFASNSVFLPAAGRCSNGSVLNQGNRGYYWSSTLYDNSYACSLYFDSRYQNDCDDRSLGYSVRAVLAED